MATNTQASHNAVTYDYHVTGLQMELKNHEHDKFYRLYELRSLSENANGNVVLVRHWGRRGANGQSMATVTYKWSTAYEEFVNLPDKKEEKGYQRIYEVNFDISFPEQISIKDTNALTASLLAAFSQAWFNDVAKQADLWDRGISDDADEVFMHIPSARVTAHARPPAAMALDSVSSHIVFENRDTDSVVVRIDKDAVGGIIDLFNDVSCAEVRPGDTVRTVQSALVLMSRGGRYDDFRQAIDVGRRIES